MHEFPDSQRRAYGQRHEARSARPSGSTQTAGTFVLHPELMSVEGKGRAPALAARPGPRPSEALESHRVEAMWLGDWRFPTGVPDGKWKADPAGPLRSSVWPAGPADLSRGRNGENLRPAGQDFNAAAIRSTAAKSPSRRVT